MARTLGSPVARMAIAAVVIAAVAVAWRSTAPTEVNAVITGVHCSWAPLRLGDIIVTATARNPSSRARDFSWTAHFSLRGGGEQDRDGGSFAAGAEGSIRLWADVTTNPHSKPGGPIARCGASARSYTPTGD